ncbi:MAG: hypothetical protein ACI4NM_00640 [Bullifex sp.]
MLSLVSCKGTEKEAGFAGLANPFTDVSSLTEAGNLCGFSITLPEFPEEYDDVHYRVLTAADDKMLEIIFENGMEDEIRVRKQAGNSDISGDYNSYGNVISEDGITIKGNDGMFSAAIWNMDGFSYSLSLSVPAASDYLLMLTKQVR